MLVRELISQFKSEWLPVDILLQLDKKAEVSRQLIASLGDTATLLAWDSMPLWRIRGIGPKRAMDLWRQGVRPGTLSRHLKLLPNTTRLALQYKPLDKIPRAVVEAAFDDFVPFGEKSHCTIVGSYRRGRPSSGDIDILYDGDFERFISKIKDHLKDRWIPMSQGPSKAAGIFLYRPNKAVEVDIWICRPENRAAMMLYATGSAKNNIRMRHIAKSRGLKLNQYGVWRDDQLIPVKTERDIFTALGMKWRAPQERDN